MSSLSKGYLNIYGKNGNLQVYDMISLGRVWEIQGFDYSLRTHFEAAAYLNRHQGENLISVFDKMERLNVLCFLMLCIIYHEFIMAEDTRDLVCKHNYVLTLNGVKDVDNLWNTSFTLEKWNATSNWTFLVEHRATETKGKLQSYMRGYLAEGQHNVNMEGMKRIWACDNLDVNGNSIIYNGPKIREDFGVISSTKWNTTEGKIHNTIRYWQTSSDCTTFSSCRNVLIAAQMEQNNSKGNIFYNFHIVPDGNVLEGLGWDKIYNEEIIINVISKKQDVFPTTVAREAFAYLLQVGVSLGKFPKDFYTLHPSHTSTSLDNEMRTWANSYKNSFDRDLTLSRVDLDGEVQVISRMEWNAIKPMREFDTTRIPAEVVEIRISTPGCVTHEDCAKSVRDLQLQDMKSHSDIFSNFIFGGDGMIYEGLGWDRSRKEKTIYFDFLLTSVNSMPWTQVLGAFTLQLREGVLLGRISERYTINIPSNVDKKVFAKVMKWGEWARNIVKENYTITLQTIGGEESLVSRIDINSGMQEKEVFSLDYPINTILFTQSNAPCDELKSCLPYYKTLGMKSLRSPSDVKSNFYFADDGILYEGLGWDVTARKDQVIFEFLTANSNTLPSNRSLAASTFLVREGLKKGYLDWNYHIMVGKHTSIPFENMVRFWDTRIREW